MLQLMCSVRSKILSNGEHPIMLRVCKGGSVFESLSILNIRTLNKNRTECNSSNRESIMKVINKQEHRYPIFDKDKKNEELDFF